MNFRQKFLEDLKCNVIIKDKQTFKELARVYGYPTENGANLCKKDYYKFIEDCKNKDIPGVKGERFNITLNKNFLSNADIFGSSGHNVDLEKYENLVLKSKWEVQTKGGGIETLKSYTNNITPIQIKQFRDSIIEDISKYSPVNKFKFTKKSVNQNNILLLSLPDYHIGRETLSMDIVEKYINVLSNIISKTDMSTIEKIVYVIGNDFFNSDSNYATTKGTPQFDFNTWTETWNFGKNLLLHSVEFLKQFNLPIDIINVPGNHDANKMFYLGDLVSSYFRNDTQIKVDNRTQLFKEYIYGTSLLMFEHGEMREGDYPLIMASEFPKQWGDSKFRYTFCGHLHHQIVKEFRGNCFVKFLPSLAKSSTWELSKGYKTSPKAEACIINSTDGLIYNININY